eukprot:scaffold834_cov123-Cylindrotheca_fusiformis.AAC.45
MDFRAEPRTHGPETKRSGTQKVGFGVGCLAAKLFLVELLRGFSYCIVASTMSHVAKKIRHSLTLCLCLISNNDDVDAGQC